MKPEVTGVSLVVVGRFQVADLDLAALKTAKALSEGELTQAKYELLVPAQAVSILLPWGKVQVLQDKIVIETTEAPYVRALDLGLKMIKEISPSAVVRMFGINVAAHFRFGDVETRDAFACKLVPPTRWGSFGEAVQQTFSLGGDKHGGLMKVTMRQPRPEGRNAGWLDITVEPSLALLGDLGVAVITNDHFDVSPEDSERLRGNERALSEELLDQMTKNFDMSIERSLRVADELVNEK